MLCRSLHTPARRIAPPSTVYGVFPQRERIGIALAFIQCRHLKKGYIKRQRKRRATMETTPTHTVQTTQPSQPADVDALIQEYAPLVKYVAQRLACRLPDWICLDDLISTGVLGLMDAIAKYDPTRGTTFKTYAEWRIRGAMLDALRELDWKPRTSARTLPWPSTSCPSGKRWSCRCTTMRNSRCKRLALYWR